VYLIALAGVSEFNWFFFLSGLVPERRAEKQACGVWTSSISTSQWSSPLGTRLGSLIVP
jgi:hypothetical protein